tara:strand:+ start:563 stop:1240 length:678 start_codon:yes stop_codon:yes gene_type:complete
MLKKIEDIPVEQKDKLTLEAHFATPIYTLFKPEYLDVVQNISKKRLKAVKKEKGLNEHYPVLMSDNFFDDPSLEPFVSFVGQTSWNILNEQGYAMQNMVVQFTEMWTQEHHTHSLMEQHTHRFGSQIVGFYFLDVPPDAPRALFYDPRQGTVQGSLPEGNPDQLSFATSVVNYEPKPGLFIFTNSWLAHSFTKNISKKPFSFVHFNLTVAPNLQPVQADPEVEIV